MTTLVTIASLAAALGAALRQAWLRVLRPRVVLWHVRRRYGAAAAWVVRRLDLHRHR